MKDKKDRIIELEARIRELESALVEAHTENFTLESLLKETVGRYFQKNLVAMYQKHQRESKKYSNNLLFFGCNQINILKSLIIKTRGQE